MPITRTEFNNMTRWTCNDVIGTYAVIALADGEVNTYPQRDHLDEEEARELFTALQAAFDEKGEQSHD